MPVYVAAVATVVAAGISAYGAVSSANAQSNANKYNATIATDNAQIAKQNADFAAISGRAQAEQAALQTRAKIGGIKAQQAASGVDVDSGTDLDVRSSAQELGELNAINVRSNAVRQAYGYQNQSFSDTAQSSLDRYGASSAQTAGDISASSTLIGGIGKTAGGLSSGGGGTSPDGNPSGSYTDSTGINWNPWGT